MNKTIRETINNRIKDVFTSQQTLIDEIGERYFDMKYTDIYISSDGIVNFNTREFGEKRQHPTDPKWLLFETFDNGCFVESFEWDVNSIIEPFFDDEFPKKKTLILI